MLLSRVAPYMGAAASQLPSAAATQTRYDIREISQLHKGLASLQQRVETLAKALAVNGINV